MKLEMDLDILSAASRVLDAVYSSNKPIAVFIVSGRVRMTALNSDLYQQAIEQIPEKLLGVYDKSVNHDWLLKDLEEAESEVRNGNHSSL